MMIGIGDPDDLEPRVAVDRRAVALVAGAGAEGKTE